MDRLVRRGLLLVVLCILFANSGCTDEDIGSSVGIGTEVLISNSLDVDITVKINSSCVKSGESREIIIIAGSKKIIAGAGSVVMPSDIIEGIAVFDNSSHSMVVSQCPIDDSQWRKTDYEAMRHFTFTVTP